MKEEKVKGVIRWLTDLLNWTSEEPRTRVFKTLDILEKNKTIILDAINEVIRDEFREYLDWILQIAGHGKGKENTSGVVKSNGGGEGKHTEEGSGRDKE